MEIWPLILNAPAGEVYAIDIAGGLAEDKWVFAKNISNNSSNTSIIYGFSSNVI